jgi:hypothetical protein
MRGGEGARRGLRGERMVKKFFKSAFLFDLFLGINQIL